MVNHVFNVISCLLDFSDNSANISLVVSSGLTQLPLNRSSQKHTHFQQKSLEFISPQWQWTVEALRRSAHQQHLFPPPWFTVGRRLRVGTGREETPPLDSRLPHTHRSNSFWRAVVFLVLIIESSGTQLLSITSGQIADGINTSDSRKVCSTEQLILDKNRLLKKTSDLQL